MKKVLVTGISGYIGQHCAVELLKSGYAVKGSLRSFSKSDVISASIEGEIDTQGRLEFCELNLNDDFGWDAAMLDVDYLMHVASPFVAAEPRDENDLIKPAVLGTQRALKAAKKAGVKRVVLTSSIAAMLGDKKGFVAINSAMWTDIFAPNRSAYIKSKTLAERSAWEFIQSQEKEGAMEMVAINPGFVFGPALSENLSGESMRTFKEFMTGKIPVVPKISMSISDVRDVAKIHVMALENRQASGNRYIVSTSKAYSFQEIAQVLKRNGYTKVSTKLAPNILLKFMALFSREIKGSLPYIGNTLSGDIGDTLNTFDWKPIAFEKTILDTAKCIEKYLTVEGN